MIIHNKKEEEEKYFEPVSAWEGEKEEWEERVRGRERMAENVCVWEREKEWTRETKWEILRKFTCKKKTILY